MDKNLCQRHRFSHLKVSVLEGRKHSTSVSQLCHQHSLGTWCPVYLCSFELARLKDQLLKSCFF